MHIIYIDDSQERPLYCFSGISIPSEKWAFCFSELKTWRRKLKGEYGIFVNKEFHAWKFVSGRGRIAPSVISKWHRAKIFRDTLTFLNGLEDVRIFNVCLASKQSWAFERLLNRINRTMKAWDSHALLICDSGKEDEYTRLVRKMSVHNPIPSRFGTWRGSNKYTKNIPIDRIIEDPIFKDSAKSYFVQMADFCAYSLLRKEQHLPSKNKYGIHKGFANLGDICVKEANLKDEFGIIR